MSERERMEKGLLYNPMDKEIADEQSGYLKLLGEFNATQSDELGKREALLKKMFGAIGSDCYIEPPFHANWGGKHVFFGDWVYANFNLTLVDDGNIYVGNNVMFAPNVTLATAGHPVWPPLRERGLQFVADIHIGNNVWIGANAAVMPGVTIGDNAVIGAGSVVTRDIPSNVVAVGNPCRVLREIGERDREYYFRDKKIDIE